MVKNTRAQAERKVKLWLKVHPNSHWDVGRISFSRGKIHCKATLKQDPDIISSTTFFHREPPTEADTRQWVFEALHDLLADFVIYDRSCDEDLPLGEIDRLIESEVLSTEELSQYFLETLNSILLKRKG